MGEEISGMGWKVGTDRLDNVVADIHYFDSTQLLHNTLVIIVKIIRLSRLIAHWVLIYFVQHATSISVKLYFRSFRFLPFSISKFLTTLWTVRMVMVVPCTLKGLGSSLCMHCAVVSSTVFVPTYMYARAYVIRFQLQILPWSLQSSSLLDSSLKLIWYKIRSNLFLNSSELFIDKSITIVATSKDESYKCSRRQNGNVNT